MANICSVASVVKIKTAGYLCPDLERFASEANIISLVSILAAGPDRSGDAEKKQKNPIDFILSGDSFFFFFFLSPVSARWRLF